MVLAEALALLVVAGLTVRTALSGDATPGGLWVGVTVLALAVAALLMAAGRALARGRRWGRAPVLTWQVQQLAVAVPAVQGDRPLVPLALVVASVAVAVGLFLPVVVRHTSVGGGLPAL